MMEVNGICGCYTNPRAYAQSTKSVKIIAFSNTKKRRYTNKYWVVPAMTAALLEQACALESDLGKG